MRKAIFELSSKFYCTHKKNNKRIEQEPRTSSSQGECVVFVRVSGRVGVGAGGPVRECIFYVLNFLIFLFFDFLIFFSHFFWKYFLKWGRHCGCGHRSEKAIFQLFSTFKLSSEFYCTHKIKKQSNRARAQNQVCCFCACEWVCVCLGEGAAGPVSGCIL